MYIKMTQEVIQDITKYNKINGSLYWKTISSKYFSHCGNPEQHTKTWNSKNAGKSASKIHESSPGYFYKYTVFKRKRYKSHQLIWLYMTGKWPKYQIDHIDGDATNNIWDNLRDIPQRKNMQNTRLSNNNTSGIKGLSWCKERQKWEVYIAIDKLRRNLGRFTDFNDAARARYNAEVKYNWLDTNSSAYNYLKEHNLLLKDVVK